MNIMPVNIYNIRVGYNSVLKNKQSGMYRDSINCDCFIKSSKNVTFCGTVDNIQREFNIDYPSSFFRKILHEGVPCAYTGIPLVSGEDIQALKSSGVLNKKSSLAIKALKPYKDSMYPVEKEIFSILENLSKKHPDLSLQELLALKYNSAEKPLIRQQAAILDKINMASRGLPQEEYKKMRQLINESFDKIYEPDMSSSNRFKRRELIMGLKDIGITDSKLRQKIFDYTQLLPTSETSINAFIVKYSKPNKLKYDAKRGIYTTVPRLSEDIGLRLLQPSIGSDDHIHPQKLYSLEQLARERGEEWAKDLSKYKVTILTTRRINEEKMHEPFNEFVNSHGDFVIKNIKNHINRLIEIDRKWLTCGKYKDAKQLADYIYILSNELENRSEKLHIDLTGLDEIIDSVNEKAQIAQVKTIQKRLKKSGHADNSHGEHYIANDGSIVENRKYQIHQARYKQ